MIPEGPLLWFVNRGTGFALLGVLTLAVVLGVVSTRLRAGGLVPGFVLQSLHRSVSLLGVSLLGVHVATAVLDEFVDIDWQDAVLPAGAAYEPVWLGVGAVSLDLVLAVVLTSLLRHRLGHGSWRAIHLLAYLAWAAGFVHGLGIGTDTGRPWATVAYLVCLALAVGAGLLRLTALARSAPPRRVRT